MVMLDTLTDSLNGVFKKLRARGKLHPKQVDNALGDIRTALLEADVAVEVADDLVARVRARALGEEVMKSLTPAQQVIKVVRDELQATMGGTQVPFTLPSAGFYSSNDTISKQPAVLKQFVAALKEAIALSAKNPNLARRVVPKFTGMTPATAKLVTLPVFDSRITPGSVGPMLLLMQKYGWIKNVPAFNSIVWQG